MQSVFFSPKALTTNGWTWGVGAVLLVPTATDDLLGGKKWGAGPTGVALKQTATYWTYGVLFNHIWSFAGDDDRNDISGTFLQPFVVKGLGQGRTNTVNLESTYDWESEQWTVPLNVGYSKVSRIGKQLVSYQGGVRYYVEAPDNGPGWGLRFTITFLPEEVMDGLFGTHGFLGGAITLGIRPVNSSTKTLRGSGTAHPSREFLSADVGCSARRT